MVSKHRNSSSAFICEQVGKTLQEPLGSVNNLIGFICLDYM